MTKVKDGKLVDKTVDVKTYASIEHGNINKITSIVLHRTDSSNASSTIQAYANGKKSGAHFLIDKAGKIYQTADMRKICADVPFACKGGVCCTCKAKVMKGSVSMRVNYGLDEDDLKNNIVLTCQAVPTSKEVVLDYDDVY